MGSLYYDWDASWTPLTHSVGTDISNYDLKDEATLTSDALSLDNKVAVELSAKFAETAGAACDENLYLYVLRDTDGTNYQTINDKPALGAIIDPSGYNSVNYKAFTVDAGEVSSLKVLVDNNCGQSGNLTMMYRYAVMTTV
jgi:hypothetical protein